MPTKRTATNIKHIALVVVLFVLSGLSGYFASMLLGEQKQTRDIDEVQVTHSKPTATEPDTKACIAALPIDIKLAQKLMFAVYSDQAATIAPVLADIGVGGVIIMDETSADQIGNLLGSFRIKPIVAVDQEGGTVQRYKTQGLLPFGSVKKLW